MVQSEPIPEDDTEDDVSTPEPEADAEETDTGISDASSFFPQAHTARLRMHSTPVNKIIFLVFRNCLRSFIQ